MRHAVHPLLLELSAVGPHAQLTAYIGATLHLCPLPKAVGRAADYAVEKPRVCDAACVHHLFRHPSSRRISRGDLSPRTPMNSGWRSKPSRVHSTNDTSTTTLGFTQRNVAMSSAVMPSPQWLVLLLGRFAKGHRACTMALSA